MCFAEPSLDVPGGLKGRGAAAEFADLSVRRFLDVLEERDVEANYTGADLADDLAAVRDR